MQGYKHDVYIVNKSKVVGGKIVPSGEKMVSIANNSDPFYSWEFETRQEIDDFIEQLKKARDKAFVERSPQCSTS